MKKKSRRFFAFILTVILVSLCVSIPASAKVPGKDTAEPTMYCKRVQRPFVFQMQK